jgi:hypothetical protein
VTKITIIIYNGIFIKNIANIYFAQIGMVCQSIPKILPAPRYNKHTIRTNPMIFINIPILTMSLI